MFLIAKRAKDIKCPERLAVCKEVLSTADEKLHVIARKLKFVYKDQLVFCADNCGVCRLELWLLVDLWARYCPADTQSIEGFNNIVTNATVLAPNIKLPLLNARCASRSFCLGTLGANAYNLSSVKFSEMKDDLEAALQRAIDNHAGHTEVLAEFDRFAAPLPSAPAQKARPDVIDPALQKTETHIWAAHYSSMWTKYHRGANAGLRCLLLIQRSDGGRDAYLCPLLHRHIGYLLKLDTEFNCDGKQMVIGLSRPLVYKSTLDVFLELYGDRQLRCAAF